MIGAAQAVLFVAAEPQRRAAMRAEFIGQGIATTGVAPGKQPLGEKLHANGRAVVFRQFLDEEDGNPVAPQQIAHERARAGPRHQFVLFGRQHVVFRSFA